jgi:hypothetical protein
LHIAGKKERAEYGGLIAVHKQWVDPRSDVL